MEKKLLIGFCVVLLFGMTVTGEDKSTAGWSSNVFCFYTMPENATNASIAQCYKLSYTDKVLLNNNLVFVVSPPEKLKPSLLFVLDESYANLTQNIPFEGSIKKIVKFKNLFSNNGEILSLCASGDNFAFGSSDRGIYFYESVNNSSRLKWKSFGEGNIKACDIQSSGPYMEYIAVCSGDYVEVFDGEGNLKWKKDLGGVCKGADFFNDEVISAGPDKFSVFLIDGTEKFSRDIAGIKSVYSGKKAVILAEDGVYAFDGAVNKIINGKFDAAAVSGVSERILLYSGTEFYVSDYSGKIFWSYNFTAGDKITASAVDERYALIGTDTAGIYAFELDKGGNYLLKLAHDSAIIGFNPGVVSLSLNKGKIAVGYSDGVVFYFDVIMGHAVKRMSEIESIISAAKASGMKTEGFDVKLNQMRESYNQSQYSRTLDIASQLDSEISSMKKEYVSEAMGEINELIKKTSDFGLVIPRSIKENYDNAYRYYNNGEYDNANNYLQKVKVSLTQFIRDCALDRFSVVKKARDAINKEGIPTTLDTQISEIDELKDYASAIVLFDKVRTADNTVADTVNKLLKDADDAVKNVHNKFIFADPSTKDPEDQIKEARAYLEQEDFPVAIGKITAATKHAKDLKTLALVEDICIIVVILSAVIILIFFLRRPKVG